MVNLLSTLKRAGTRANENLFPEPAEGLLSKEDIGRARREGMLHLGLSLLGDTSGMGLGSALASAIPAGKQAYQGAAQDVLTQRKASRQEQEIARQQQRVQLRDTIMAKYKLGPDATPEQIFEQFPKMYSELMSAGLTDDAKSLQTVVQQIMQDKPKPQTFLSDGTLARVGPEGRMEILGSLPLSPDRKEQNDLDRQLKLAQVRLANTQAQSVREQAAFTKNDSAAKQIGKDFLSLQPKKVMGSEYMYNQWRAALGSARGRDVAAFKSAIVNYINIADPGAQIRLGVLQFLSDLDPSAKGRWQMGLEKWTAGKHPDYLLSSMERHVDKIHQGTVNTYRQRRDARVEQLREKYPTIEIYMPPATELFPSIGEIDERLGGQSAAATGGGSRVSRFLNYGAPLATPAPVRPAGPYRTPGAQPPAVPQFDGGLSDLNNPLRRP